MTMKPAIRICNAGHILQLQMTCNKATYCRGEIRHGPDLAARTTWRSNLERAASVRGGLAARAHHALALGSVRHHRHAADRLAVAQAHRLSRAWLSGCRRLHGPGQLGDLARRRFEIRLLAAHHRAHLESDG